jgi:DNA-directed RNA polymerase specialized sigma24 family protein
MKNILDILFLKHSQWLKYVKSFGCPDDIAEDYVQEMYIKIHNYSQRKDNDLMYSENDVNYYFIYVTLKNMFYDDLRKAKKQIKVDLSDDFIQDESEYTETDYHFKNDAKNVWIERLNSEIESIEEYNRKKANLMYIKFIFEKIFVEQMSVTKLSQEVGITYWSLRNTILIIKDQIKNETRTK